MSDQHDQNTRDEPIDDETVIHLEGAAALSFRAQTEPDADSELMKKAKARAGDPAADRRG